MLDIKLVRENPDLVKENIKKKFQEEKLALVDEVIELDKKFRESKQRADELRASRNKISKEIGGLMAKGLREEAEKTKQKVAHLAKELEELEGSEETLSAEIKKRMMVIPNIIGDDVPIGKDDSENVELQRFGEPYVPPFEIPYHVDIMEKLHGIDLDSARKTSGNGFYYLCGDIARLHSAVTRGIDNPAQRTSFIQLKVHAKDWMVLCFFLVAFVVLFFCKYQIYGRI